MGARGSQPSSAEAPSVARHAKPIILSHLGTFDRNKPINVTSASPLTVTAAKLCRRTHGECPAAAPRGDPAPAISAPATNRISVQAARETLRRCRTGCEFMGANGFLPRLDARSVERLALSLKIFYPGEKLSGMAATLGVGRTSRSARALQSPLRANCGAWRAAPICRLRPLRPAPIAPRRRPRDPESPHTGNRRPCGRE